MTAAAALFFLCLLVLFSNFNDRQHSQEVNQSISTLYEDRLMAESYIVHLTDGVHQIRELLGDSKLDPIALDREIGTVLIDVNHVNNAYEKTKFTKDEAIKYAEFKGLCQQMGTFGIYSADNKMAISKQALDALNALSNIQVEESKSIISKSERLFNSGKMSSDFAMAVVIIIGLVLQALVFSSKTLNNPKVHSAHPNLN